MQEIRSAALLYTCSQECVRRHFGHVSQEFEVEALSEVPRSLLIQVCPRKQNVTGGRLWPQGRAIDGLLCPARMT